MIMKNQSIIFRNKISSFDESNSNIEAARGFAALLVAFFHIRVIAWIGIREYHHAYGVNFSLNSLLSYITFPITYGAIGVPIFFVISGYCIHKNQATKLKENKNYKLAVSNFLYRRFVRIYPVLIGALLLTYAFDTASSNFHPLNERLGDLSPMNFLGNVLALQGITSTTYGSDGALWTLSLEIQFYLFYSIVFKSVTKIGNKKTFLAILFINIASYFTFERHGIIIFTSYWLCWYIGAFLAELEVRENGVPSNITCAIASTLLILFGAIISGKSQYFSFQIWAIGFAFLLILIFNNPSFFRSKFRVFFEKIGEFSYSLYIIHIPIAVFLTSWIFNSKKPASIFYSLIFLAIAVLFAYVFHLLIERPSMKWIRHARSQRSRSLS